MKRPFNIFDGLFLMALYFKLTGTGLVLSWPAIFLPHMVEATLGIIAAFSRLFNWHARIKYHLWKFALNIRMVKAGNKARQFMKDQYNEGFKQGKGAAHGGNPGRFTDPKNFGQ